MTDLRVKYTIRSMLDDLERLHYSMLIKAKRPAFTKDSAADRYYLGQRASDLNEMIRHFRNQLDSYHVSAVELASLVDSYISYMRDRSEF